MSTAKTPTPRICVIYIKDGIEQQSPWFTCRARAEQAKAISSKNDTAFACCTWIKGRSMSFDRNQLPDPAHTICHPDLLLAQQSLQNVL